ncbi:MAG: hypothetical protein C0445_00750 [Polaromonas sp.]|nr:hypothetical protein [Polaromonas sp.]
MRAPRCGRVRGGMCNNRMNFQETDVIPYSTSVVPSAPDVWVFAPHPDDEVFGCGGSIALHVLSGHRVQVVLLTAGDQQQANALSDGRLQESQAAALVLGHSLQSWGLPDRGLSFNESLVGRMMACLEATPHCVVYAPSLWEAHPDHRVCAMAAIEAVRRLGGDRVLCLYEVSAPLRANCLVDITAVWAQKAKAMACFVSQEGVLPYAEFVGSLNRYRALTVLQSGHVEAFERHEPKTLRQLAIESPAAGQRRQGVAVVPEDVPLVSVVVRTQGRATLPEAVASVLGQTYPRCELVLVNASGVPSLAAEFPDWEGARWVGGECPLGRSAAANLGLSHAQGAWIVFLDDDDWLYADHVDKLVSRSRQSRDAVAFYSDVECVGSDGAPTGVVFAQPYAPRELMYGNFLPIHSVLFSRKVWEGGARFDEAFDLYEDWDFWLQVESAGRLERVPGVSAAYRVGEGAGAGVSVDAGRGRQATEAIFSKWGRCLDAASFFELVSRSLDRRQLLHRVNGLQSELTQVHADLRAEQLSGQQSLREAETARLDAHALRKAHDAACVDRDQWRADWLLVRQDREEALAQSGRWQRKLGEVEAELGAVSAQCEASRAQNAALEAELQSLHARLHQAELRAEQHLARFTQVVGSRSWRLTRPVRMVTRFLHATKRLGWFRAAERGLEVVREEGLGGLVERESASVTEVVVAHGEPKRTYTEWVAEFDRLDGAGLALLAEDVAALKIRPLISIVMPVYNTQEQDLVQAVASVQAQIYQNWELCICDDASTAPHVSRMLAEFSAADARIKVVRHTRNQHISAASNTAIGMASGDYVAFLDHDDALAPHALLRVVEWLQAHPGTRLMYSDEDKLALDGSRFDPYFKPDFNLGLLRSHNYMCHFAVYERELLRTLDGLRLGYEGAQDYDMVLRAVDALQVSEIGHLPHVLYHWRVTVGSTAGGHQEKSYAFTAGQRALEAHLNRRGLGGHVIEAAEAPGMYRVCWHLPEDAPMVSIVIPTRNGEALLRMCLDTLRQTTYRSYEVIVIDNGSDDPGALGLMADRERAGEIRVLRDARPFNFSALNNKAVREMARGEFVVLMNNDIEITQPDWLGEMVGVALEGNVGCVGARLWYPDGRLQHGGVIMVCGVAGHAHKYLPRGRHGYMGRAVLAQDFLAVTAACLLVRRSIFDAVGGLDETLQVAFNDVDFCLKVHAAGYRNVWTPFAEMVHHESVSRGHEDTPEKQKRFSGEVAILQTRWPDLLANDPCYSPNLTNQAEDFSLAWPPRRKLP